MIPEKLLRRLALHVLSGVGPTREDQALKNVIPGQDDLVHYPGILIESSTLCGLHENNLWDHPKYHGSIDFKRMEESMKTRGYIECRRHKVSCPECINKTK